MSKTIVVGWGACAPIRPKHIMTALKPRGVKVERLVIDTHESGSDAYITVNDAQARVAEYWLLRCGLFGLYSPPIDARNIKWAQAWHTIPAQRGCGNHTHTGTVGAMPEQGRKRRQQRPARRRTNARQRQQAQQDSGILGTVVRLFKGG